MLAALIAAAFCLYARALGHGFSLLPIADVERVAANRLIRDPAWRGVPVAFGAGGRSASPEGDYQPLTVISFMLDGLILQRNPDLRPEAVFRLSSITLHVINSVLVLVLLERLGAASLVAAAFALAFGVHPVNVEAVVWIAQRGVLLGTSLALLGVIAYLRPNASRYGRMIPSGLLYGLALLASPIASPLPFVLLLLDRWPLKRLSRAALIEKAPLLLPMLLMAIWGIRWRPERGSDMAVAGVVDTTALVLANLVSVWRRIVWPAGLSPDYPLNGAFSVSTTSLLFHAAIVAGVTAAAWSLRKRRPELPLALFSFLILLTPALAKSPLRDSLTPDRFACLPLAFLLIAPAVWISSARPGEMAWPVVGGVAALLALTAARLIPNWQDGMSYYSRVLALYPHDTGAKVGLARGLLAGQRPAEALRYLEDAVRAEPEDADHRYHFGVACWRVGRTEDALAAFEQAVRLDPDPPEHHAALAGVLAAKGRYADALPHFEIARGQLPRSGEVHLGLGFAYLELQKPASARAALQTALDLQPQNPWVHLGLSRAWVAMDVLDVARAHLAEAVRLDPRFVELAVRQPGLRELTESDEFQKLLRSTHTEATQSTAPSTPFGGGV